MLNAITDTDSELGGTVLTVIFVFFLLGAVILLINGLFALVDAHRARPNNSKFGAWGKIIVGSLIASLDEVLTSADQTIFGSGAAPGGLGARRAAPAARRHARFLWSYHKMAAWQSAPLTT